MFFEELKIPEPAVNLGIQNLAHGAMTGRMLEKLEKIFQEEQPDWVLVFGDTNSTLAGALAASKLHIKVAHVEAGLRSFNRQMPEEINRVITDQLSELLFVPSNSSKQNLLAEGLKERSIHEVGDIMYDALLEFKKHLKPLQREQPYTLLTLHRQENVDNPAKLKEIVSAVNQISKEIKVLFPVHPRTRSKLGNYSFSTAVELCEPLGYLQMLSAIMGARFVMTDSGGLQKEAFYLGKQCVTLREETEWTELVDLGVNRIVGSDQKEIVEAAKDILKNPGIKSTRKPYGDGCTAQKITEVLRNYAP